ncbi:NADH-quinone oxidoreductase subunit C [Aestuariivivens insulae]|uniref:NADH-quinone oxidoreductase subunit C n=1 Tax=Aestuariivivens insulae TaxID=1621988 RepID=UPI001F57545B|nr:NADH-quinone oxidoreductase subunit C [Aestuariivivens insulae]
MTNEALQELIGSWFPNPEADMAKDVSKTTVEEEGDGETDPSKVEEPVPSSLLQFSEEGSQFLNIVVNPEHFHDLMLKLKTNEATSFDYLFCLTGVDWGEALGVVYHLESTKYRHSVVVKVNTADRENPMLNSVCDIWRTAEFHEREVFDFFGIKFKNHPNLKRLFLTEEWDGYPLRKDYEDEINMVIK